MMMDGVGVEAVLPCTAAQTAIAGSSQADDRYIDQTALCVTGPLDPQRLRTAWEQVQRMHQATRLRLHEYAGQWIQVVGATVHPSSYVVHDLSDVPSGERERLVAEVTRVGLESLDLRAGPMVRLDLILEPHETALLVLTHHHAAVDGRTVGLLFGSLSNAYAGLRLQAPPVDLVTASRHLWTRASADAGLAFAVEIDDMPALLPTWPAQRGPADLVARRWTLAPSATRAAISRAGATPAMLIQAALLAWLAIGRSEPSSSISMAVDLRALVPQALNTSGLFLCTLPVTALIRGNDTALSIATQLAQRNVPQLAHPAISLPQVLRAASALGHHGVPDTLLTVQGSTALPPPPPGLDWQRAWGVENTEFALNIDAAWQDSLELVVQYDRCRVPAEHIDRLIADMRAMITTPSRPLGELLVEPGWLRSDRRVQSSPIDDLLLEVLVSVRRVTRQQVGPDDDLLRAGFSSLTLMSILVDLTERGIPCNLGLLLERPTARDVATFAARQLAVSAGAAVGDASDYPRPKEASGGFTRLAAGLLDQTDRTDWGPQPMHEQSMLSFATILRPALARRAWQRVVENYPRLGWTWDARSAGDDAELRCEVVKAAPEAARAWLEVQLKRPFRPQEALMRAALFVDEKRSAWAFSFHNALLDGWSFPTVIRELQLAYGALASNSEFPTPLGDDCQPYRTWLAQRDVNDAGFWRGALRGAAFPPRQGGPSPGERRVARRPDVLPILSSVAASVGSTSNMVASALGAAALARATRQAAGEALAVRATVRPANLPGAMRMVGQFAAELPIPLQSGHRATWPEAVRAFALALETAREHGHAGATGIRDAVSCPPQADVYRNLLVVEEYSPIHQWAAHTGPDSWSHLSDWRREVSPSLRTLYIEPTATGFDFMLSTAKDEDPDRLLDLVTAHTRHAYRTFHVPTDRIFGFGASVRPRAGGHVAETTDRQE